MSAPISEQWEYFVDEIEILRKGLVGRGEIKGQLEDHCSLAGIEGWELAAASPDYISGGHTLILLFKRRKVVTNANSVTGRRD